MATVCCLPSCLLCEADVSEGTMLVKRKKLLGAAAKVARDVLDGICLQKFRKKLSLDPSLQSIHQTPKVPRLIDESSVSVSASD